MATKKSDEKKPTTGTTSKEKPVAAKTSKELGKELQKRAKAPKSVSYVGGGQSGTLSGMGTGGGR